MATSGPGMGWLFSERNLDGGAPALLLARFGQRLRAEDMPSVPERYRGLDGPLGKLTSVRVRPASGEGWLRLQPSDVMRPWRRLVRIIPLNGTQAPTPAPTADVLELRAGMRVYCHEGYVGRLEGVCLDVRAGTVTELLVHIRGDVLSSVEIGTDPLAYLINVSGQRLLLPVAWISSAKQEAGSMPFRSGGVVQLDATPEQIASGTRVRSDGDIAGDILRMFEVNPALNTFTSRMRVEVHDGAVTLLGTVPTPRHRASAEQDVWHVPGVLTVHNEISVGA